MRRINQITGADSFRDAWMLQVKELIEATVGREATDDELEKASSMYGEFIEDAPTIRVINTATGGAPKTGTLDQALDRILSQQYIFSGNGTLFKREDHGGENVTGSFVETLLSTRKAVKGQMKTAMRAGDKSTADTMDTRQKVYKVLTNA